MSQQRIGKLVARDADQTALEGAVLARAPTMDESRIVRETICGFAAEPASLQAGDHIRTDAHRARHVSGPGRPTYVVMKHARLGELAPRSRDLCFSLGHANATAGDGLVEHRPTCVRPILPVIARASCPLGPAQSGLGVSSEVAVLYKMLTVAEIHRVL